MTNFDTKCNLAQVLSVHPDYLLQTEILNYMQTKWFNLTENGWHDVLASMLADQQYELVTEKLDQMTNQGMQIQSWLYDLIIYKFVEIGELDDTLRLLKQRVGDGESNISAQLWFHLLDSSTRALHVRNSEVYYWQTLTLFT